MEKLAEKPLEKTERLRGLFLILLLQCSERSSWLNDLDTLLSGAIEHMRERVREKRREDIRQARWQAEGGEVLVVEFSEKGEK